MGNKAAVIYSVVKEMYYKFPIRVYICHINGKRDHPILGERERVNFFKSVLISRYQSCTGISKLCSNCYF